MNESKTTYTEQDIYAAEERGYEIGVRAAAKLCNSFVSASSPSAVANQILKLVEKANG